MIMQISSGMGPIECRAAVGGIYKALPRYHAMNYKTINSMAMVYILPSP